VLTIDAASGGTMDEYSPGSVWAASSQRMRNSTGNISRPTKNSSLKSLTATTSARRMTLR
jgi:hypothetical protein